jgi:hypothetical protein
VPLWLRRSERSWLGLRLSHHAHCKRSSAGLNRNPSQDAPPSLPLHLPLLTPHVHHACCCCCCFCTIGGRTHRGPHRHAQQRIDTDGFWQRHHSHGLHCRSLQSPDTVMPRPEAEQQSSSPTGQTERLMPLWALSTAAPPPAPSTDPSPLVTIATATNIDTTTADTSDTNVAVLDEDTFEALGVPIDGTLARHSIRYSHHSAATKRPAIDQQFDIHCRMRTCARCHSSRSRCPKSLTPAALARLWQHAR